MNFLRRSGKAKAAKPVASAKNTQTSNADALASLEADIDIKQEVTALASAIHGLSVDRKGNAEEKTESHVKATKWKNLVPLNYRPGQGGHRANKHTLRMFNEVSEATIQRATQLFYESAFQDYTLDRLIRDRKDPHGTRFADWIAEKFGAGQPWSTARATRKTCPFMSHGHRFETPHDRSSAHYAAWHSPKRERHEFGQHFKLDDCRVWMRLHFGAMRKAGAFEHEVFADYYVKFIGHFVSVYERKATAFARESARWSEDPSNIEKYTKAGRKMVDVIGVPDEQAIRSLPREEWEASRAGQWPYSY